MNFEADKKIYFLISSSLHISLFLFLAFLSKPSFLNSTNTIYAFSVVAAKSLAPTPVSKWPRSRKPQIKATKIIKNIKIDKEIPPFKVLENEIAEENNNTIPTPANENLVTEGVRVLNMNDVTKSVKRTPEAMLNNIQGKIKLKLLVDKNGHVRKITPLNKLGFGLDEIALQAANKLLFMPARINLKSVALEAIYIINFSITHQ